MLSFSERNGYRPISSIIQKESMNNELRIAIWNVLYEKIFSMKHYSCNEWDVICSNIWKSYYKKTIDEYDYIIETQNGPVNFVFEYIKSYILDTDNWFLIYDLVEFIINQITMDVQEVIDALNQALISENSAYRIINKQVVPITNTEEIKSIEQAMSSIDSSVNAHLDRALAYLSDRKEHDYRNSVKESISAVEAICRIITNNDKATLGDCLNIIKNEGYAKHEAFLAAFKKLYGYTNDAGGMRHSLLEGKEKPTFGEAKFMLVACSAFVNYIWEIASEKHLIKDSNE